jgi:TRAP-type mannitol/chloroaromatic compound transport system substrate-binding protein
MTKDTKSDWEIAREAMIVANKKALDLLPEQQTEAIKLTMKTLESVTIMLSETNDMYLSDLRKLESARWKLYNAFRTA